jgi:hypothetical protein
MYANWTEYVEPDIVNRWMTNSVRKSDLVPLARAYWKYAHPERTATECLHLIVYDAAMWNSIDLDPDNLNWAEMTLQMERS